MLDEWYAVPVIADPPPRDELAIKLLLLERLGALARRLPVSLRLALRDIGRQRTRNGPVVAAVLATLALSVLASTVIAAMDAADREAYGPQLRADQVLVTGQRAGRVADDLARHDAAIAVAQVGYPAVDEIPVAATVEGGDTGSGPSRSWEDIAVGDAELVRALGGSDAAVAALERDGVVLFGNRSSAGGTVDALLEISERDPVAVDATVVELRRGKLLVTDGVATPALLRRLAGDAEVTTVEIDTGYVNDVAMANRALVAGALLISLLVLAIALALSAAESRGDQRALLEVGADPDVRRRIAAGRAAVLTGLSGLLAVPAGLTPAAGLLMSSPRLGLVVPWAAVATVVLVMPAIAVLGAYLLTRPAPAWVRFTARTS